VSSKLTFASGNPSSFCRKSIASVLALVSSGARTLVRSTSQLSLGLQPRLSDFLAFVNFS
jgi:hypothetical protein